MEKKELLEEMFLEATWKRVELEERIDALEEERSTLQAEVAALRLKAVSELEAKCLAFSQNALPPAERRFLPVPSVVRSLPSP